MTHSAAILSLPQFVSTEGLMKRRAILMGSVFALAAAPTAFASELRGTYFAVEGGASWVESESLLSALFLTAGGTSATTLQGELDTGWTILGSVGYAFANHLRAEFEIGFRNNNVDQVITSTGKLISTTGDLSEFSVMANLAYDIPLTSRLSASIGAGIGADNADLDVAALGVDDNDWVFAYQGLLGLNYKIGERSQIFLNYRYLHADAPDYAGFVSVPAPATQRVSFIGDLEKHAVTVGLRFKLEAEQAAPPAPPPPPPPVLPPAPAIPRQFIVFFGFDRTDLTPEAARVVGDAADAARRTGTASIAIIGHTDSSGSPAYNQRLSQRRADVVRAELVRLGFDAASIASNGKGESDLTVKTADGVQEPQNRRATIDLQ
jgi:outer membrane protein OmpA-like peptidoglycan-associated protein